MFDRDFCTAGVPADGTSSRYCLADVRIAQEDERDTPELARPAQPYLYRQSARPTAGRRRQRACPLRARPGRPDRGGARSGKDRADRGPLPGPAHRRLPGIPRHPADAIGRPIWGQGPDLGSLITTPVNAMYRGCRAGSACIKLLTGQPAMNRARVHAPRRHIAAGHRGGRTPSALVGLPAVSREGAAHARP